MGSGLRIAGQKFRPERCEQRLLRFGFHGMCWGFQVGGPHSYVQKSLGVEWYHFTRTIQLLPVFNYADLYIMYKMLWIRPF